MAELLAKPDTELIEHLTEVTRVGEAIARQLDLPESLQVKALLACAFHDVGKATQDFQEYIRGRRKKAYPHALASFPLVFLAENLLGKQYRWGPYAYEATAAVLTHHSPLGPELYKGYEAPKYDERTLDEVWEQVWALLQQYGVGGGVSLETFEQELKTLLADPPSALLDDSLRIGGEELSLRGIFRRLPTETFAPVKAVLHLADWLASAKETQASILFLQGGLSAIVQHAERLQRTTGARLREFQILAREAAAADVFWLRAPTGTGKTEALLLWAGDTERLIYLLPTQATTNAMWKRLRLVYGERSVGLAHGRSNYVLYKSREGQEVEEDPLSERLFGSVFATPVSVATLDQYLLAHLHGRHWEERRTLARRATVILDEVHAYEPYTLGLLRESIQREPPARLALASATLPDALLGLFPKGQLVEAESPLWERRRHKILLREGALREEGIQQALEFARKGKSVLLIANTVRDAQALFCKLREEEGWLGTELLHSRFTLGDRIRKEEQIALPKAGTIFVATQVVEVSLDISYDALVTEVAPLDALVQRLGRVNRRGEKSNAPVVIYTCWSEGAQRIYGRDMLTWSLQILQELPEMPTDRMLLEATSQLYERVIRTEEWREELQAGRASLDEVQRVLGCYTIDLSDEEMRARFTARRGMVSIEVLPAQFVEQAYQLKDRGEGWRFPELLVPVPIYWLQIADGFFTALSDLHVVQTSLPYDSEVGLHAPEPSATQPSGILLE